MDSGFAALRRPEMTVEIMTSNVTLQTSVEEKAVLEAADVSAVSQLILRERLSRDLGLWEQMRDCFHDDSVVRLSWIDASGPEFVRRSKEMAERNVKASHRLGPILVTLAGDRAIAQLGAVIDIPSKVRGIAVIFSSHARFLFRAERREQVWRLSGFDAIYQRDEITPVIPGQVVTIEPNELKNFRPSYQLLSFCLMSGGYQARKDLAGIDRPDLVDALTREVYAWAGLTPPR
jgi:SnoaL-like domain